MNKTIITIAICLSFLVNSILFTVKETRRPADDLVKINSSSVDYQRANSERVCAESGNRPIYSSGEFINCEKK